VVVVVKHLACSRSRHRIRLERGDDHGRPAGRDLDVVVEQRDVVAAASLVETAVHRGGDPPVLLHHDPHLRPVFTHVLGCSVGRPVVDHDDVEFPVELLSEQRRQHDVHEVAAVVGRDGDGELRHECGEAS
jgi:hypothetical protein